MPTPTTYSETTETNIYWNLLKGLSNNVKTQLVRKLKKSLLVKQDKDESYDETVQVAYFELLKKLNTYKNYTAGWDGENAVPLSKKVIQNFNLVLEHIDRRLLVGLTIYPEINGSLLVDSQKREAGISLGETHFSYYEIENGVVSGEDKIPFSVDEFSRIVTQINR